MDSLRKFVQDNQGKIQIAPFNFIFMIMLIYTDELSNQQKKYLDVFLPEYINTIKNINITLKGDNSSENVGISLNLFAKLSFQQTFTQTYVNQIMEIAKTNLNTDSLDKNMVSILIIKEVLPFFPDPGYINNVIQMILEKDFHQSILQHLKPIFLSLSEQNALTNQIVQGLWEKTKKAHFSQQDIYRNIFVEVLCKLPFESQNQILNYL